MGVDANQRLLCPSYTCKSGARLIGIVRADGSVAFLGGAPVIDQPFVDAARHGRPPELRFRFAGTCAESACANWAGGCRIAASVSDSAGVTPADRDLPDCGIRPQCRWYHDHGARACAACPSIVRGSEHGLPYEAKAGI